jgi:hypothetical protein
LYIDLFVIIPIAISSESLEVLSDNAMLTGHLHSGPHAPLSHDTPQETHCEPCIEECPCEHHRTDRYYKRRAVLGVFLGAGSALVRVTTRYEESQEGDHFQGTLQRSLMSDRMATACKRPIMKTQFYFYSPASSISWQLASLASGRPTASRCGQMVRVGRRR